MLETAREGPATAGFHHEALIYSGSDEFVAAASAFVRDGLERAEPTMVVVSAEKIRLLRHELGSDAPHVRFADMARVGANPARIIPAWREFVSAHGSNGACVRGIGEPATAERGAAELAECHRHEALLNLAFADVRAFHLLCPYDTETLDPAAVAEAHRTHPYVVHSGSPIESDRYGGIELAAAPFDDPLTDPPRDAAELEFDADTMESVRRVVEHSATQAGLGTRRTEDIVLAVNEMATNSVRHGGGRGTLRVWQDRDALLCEVHDEGRIHEPLVGRIRPTVDQVGGFGVWLANQVCDLVQIRSVPDGTLIRLHMRRG